MRLAREGLNGVEQLRFAAAGQLAADQSEKLRPLPLRNRPLQLACDHGVRERPQGEGRLTRIEPVYPILIDRIGVAGDAVCSRQDSHCS